MSFFGYIRKWIRRIFNDRSYSDITPDEIFADIYNRPGFNQEQFEGRLAPPIKKRVVQISGVVFILIILAFLFQVGFLQIVEGETYAKESAQNTLTQQPLIAPRGQIIDRNGEELAWNAPQEDSQISKRKYTETQGLSHLLGYVSTPKKDENNNFYQKQFVGKAGVEKTLNNILQGQSGRKLVEKNALGQEVSASTVAYPRSGDNVHLSIDMNVQSKLYSLIETTARDHDYRGGAGVLMDIDTGELIALANYPEFSSQKMSSGGDEDYIQSLRGSTTNPFLNRATSGLYTPGSIVKPFVAIAALNEGAISPNKELESTKELRVQNPYDPDDYTVFTDWKAHGMVDMEDALAVSSNVYFYKVSGGYEEQEGVGISNISGYMKGFELSGKTNAIGLSENAGVIPSPEWKKQEFGGVPWRLGDTYNTAIGQYGFQITPLAAARSVAAIAEPNRLPTPTIQLNNKEAPKQIDMDIDKRWHDVVQSGMRKAVTDGTATGLDVSYVDIAAKTGTAEVAGKTEVNSWIIGFYPYEDPEYVFSAIMEHGPKDNTVGGLYVMRQLFDWMDATSSPYMITSE